MRTKVGSDYMIHVPVDDFMNYALEKVKAFGNMSLNEEFDINDVSYDKENGYINVHIDIFKRLDS